MRIRDYRPADENEVVELSLRAWAPVFASVEQVLGEELSRQLHGDWREYQARAVRGTLADDAMRVWVAEDEGAVVAFVAATVVVRWARSRCWRWIRSARTGECGWR